MHYTDADSFSNTILEGLHYKAAQPTQPFGVWGIAKDIEGDTKIALFHGTVDNSTTDFGFRLPSDVKIEIFDGYDLALLGDIHKRQFMDKEHRVAYCGSLIQQNHGEMLEHGFLTWDVPSRKATFNKIENDYGYYTLEVHDGVVPVVDDMPKKARLRVRVSNTDSSQVKKVTSEIHSRYNIKEITINRMDTLSKSKTGDEVKERAILEFVAIAYRTVAPRLANVPVLFRISLK